MKPWDFMRFSKLYSGMQDYYTKVEYAKRKEVEALAASAPNVLAFPLAQHLHHNFLERVTMRHSLRGIGATHDTIEPRSFCPVFFRQNPESSK